MPGRFLRSVGQKVMPGGPILGCRMHEWHNELRKDDWGFAEKHPERVRKAAQRLLGNPDVHVRISAARAMKQLDAPGYRQFLKREPESWVREAVRE